MGVQPAAVATGQLTAAALLMTPLVLVFDDPWNAVAPTTVPLLAIAGLALVCTALAYIFYFQLIASAGATNALLVFFLIPVPAIFLGALVLGEALDARDFVGLALIGGGLAAIDGRLLRLGRAPVQAEAAVGPGDPRREEPPASR
jgi:drug/metabolite transporter (DMT)-like permease